MTAHLINFVAVQAANFQVQQAKGIDFEASYNLPTWTTLEVSKSGRRQSDDHLCALWPTTWISLKTVGLGITTEGAGVVADSAGIGTAGLFAPKWKYLISLDYKLDAFTGTVTARGIGSGRLQQRLRVACTSACPTSTSAATPPSTAKDNHVAGEYCIYDLALNYKIFRGPESSEVFHRSCRTCSIPGLPLIAAPIDHGLLRGQGNPSNSEYDRIGRTFLMGVRFKY